MSDSLKGKVEIAFSDDYAALQHLKDLRFQKDLLERLLSLIPDAVVVIDDNYSILFHNRSAHALLSGVEGFTDSDNPELEIDSPAGTIFSYSGKKDFLSFHREVELTEPALINLSVTCFPFERGDKYCRIYIIRDVTALKNSHVLDQVNPDFIDNLTFGAGIAHELGNPIASLSLHAQLLKRYLKVPYSGLNEENQNNAISSIDTIISELGRLDETIHQFLDAVRPTNPQFTLTDIKDVISSVTHLYSHLAEKKGVLFNIHSADDIPDFLIDANRIKQAVSNVLLNAIQASFEGNAIEIQISRKDQLCEIKITDFGEGIPPEKIGNIFDPYFSTKSDGNGLGLLITYRIIRDHGGTISVKSEPGKGTDFTINLPFREKAAKLLSANY